MCIYVFYLIIRYYWIIMLSRILGKRPGLYYSINTCFVKQSRKPKISVQFSSVQSVSHVWLFATPWITACQASLSITSSQSLLKLLSIESVMPSNHLILCCPLLFPPSVFPSIRVFFHISQFFASGGQSIGVSASASVLPVNIQDLFPLGWTDWISLLSEGLKRMLSNTTVQRYQFFGAQLSLQSISHIHIWLLKKP